MGKFNTSPLPLLPSSGQPTGRPGKTGGGSFRKLAGGIGVNHLMSLLLPRIAAKHGAFFGDAGGGETRRDGNRNSSAWRLRRASMMFSGSTAACLTLTEVTSLLCASAVLLLFLRLKFEYGSNFVSDDYNFISDYPSSITGDSNFM